jgi:hypothetical protein
MWDTWVVMWSDTARAYYVLPLETGYENIVTVSMDDIGKRIEEQRKIRRENKNIGGM